MDQFETIENEMNDFNPGPKQAKGGTFAPADINLIKNALQFYVNHSGDLPTATERQAVNLLHRLGRIA